MTPTTLDLTGEIAEAVDGAALRGRPLVLGYTNEAGDPVVTFRGSVQVFGPQQLAIWSRKTSEGFAKSIENHPRVSLLYSAPDGGTIRLLSFKGTAHADPSANDAVYAAMIEGERGQDPERKGVAVIVDVDYVSGFATDGPFQLQP